MSLSANVSEKAALIWAIADKLTGVYKPHEYGEVILPLTVIRRFDCILADTKDTVLEKFETVKNLPMRDVLLRNASGKAFYNTSRFTFERLLDDPDNIEDNFRDYLNGFSENVRDILEKFKFDGQITTMANKGISKTYEQCKESVLLFERREVREKAVEKCDFDKVIHEDKQLQYYLDFPFEFHEQIVAFASTGIISKKEFSDYLELREVFRKHISIRIMFFDREDLPNSTKKEFLVTYERVTNFPNRGENSGRF